LVSSGFAEQQVEILADEQVSLLNTNLAAKSDVSTIESSIEALRKEPRRVLKHYVKKPRRGSEQHGRRLRQNWHLHKPVCLSGLSLH